MSAAGEDNTPAGEKPVEEVKAPEPQKTTKEKKPKASMEKKTKQAKTASHPPYFEMIKEALVALNEKGGSSPYAIAKYMEEKHKAVLPANFKKILSLQLKNQAAKGKLVKIKASYKLAEAGKKERTNKAMKANAEKKESRPKRSKTAGTVAASKSKKSEAVKKVAKKVGPKKTKKVSTPAKPKQPKSIRSPAKRVRRASVATS